MRLLNSKIIRDELASLRCAVDALEASEDLMTEEEEDAMMVLIEDMEKELVLFQRKII